MYSYLDCRLFLLFWHNHMTTCTLVLHDLTRKSNFKFHLFGICVYNQASLLSRPPSSFLLCATISIGAWELQPSHLDCMEPSSLSLISCTHMHSHTHTHTHTYRSHQAVPTRCGLGRSGLSSGGHAPWHLRWAPFYCAVSQQHSCWWCCGYHHSPGEVGLLV